MDDEAESGLPAKHVGETVTDAEPTTMIPPATTSMSDTPNTPDSPDDIAIVASSPSPDRCVICLDTIAEPCVAGPCGHRYFDFLCLVSWLLQRHPSCPLCKATVVSVQYGDDLEKTFTIPSQVNSKAPEAAAAAASASPTQRDSRPAERPRRRRLHPSNDASSSSSSLSASAALERRRRVYRLGLYARHVGANRHSRYYRELTPQLFAQDPDLVSRARAFLRRELQVFWPAAGSAAPGTGTPSTGTPRPLDSRTTACSSGSSGRPVGNVEFLIEYIVAILQTIDLQGSNGQAEEMLCGFLGRRDHTRQFLHELRSFLRSPYLTLASWDRHVQYGQSAFGGCDIEKEEDEGEGRQAEQPPPQGRGGSHSLRGDYWRPSRSPYRRRKRGSGGFDASRQFQSTPLYRQRRQETALQEACRRYDPS